MKMSRGVDVRMHIIRLVSRSGAEPMFLSNQAFELRVLGTGVAGRKLPRHRQLDHNLTCYVRETEVSCYFVSQKHRTEDKKNNPEIGDLLSVF